MGSDSDENVKFERIINCRVSEEFIQRFGAVLVTLYGPFFNNTSAVYSVCGLTRR